VLVLPQLALVASLLAAGPDPSPGERFFQSPERAFSVPEGTETLSFGATSLEVTPSVSLLQRIAAAPVRLLARGGDVVVWGCVDHMCMMRNELVIKAETPVEVDLPVWGQSVHLRARADNQERACCQTPSRTVRTVLVAGAPRRAAVVNIGPGSDVGLEGVGSLLRERPALLDATDAVLVLEDAAAPDAAARDAFITRGGTWMTLRDDPSRTTVERERQAAIGAGTLLELAGPLEANAFARAAAQIVPALAVQPAALYNPGHQPVVHAASVALSRSPPAALVLLVLVLAFVGAGASMWRARRGRWRSALVQGALVFAVAGAALLTLKPLFVPREVRARMVAWVGPLGATEIGIDAARPRAGTQAVVLEAPVGALGVQALGRETTPVVVHLPSGARRIEVDAHADSGAGLVWVRHNARVGDVRVVDGVLKNGLPEPIAFWARESGASTGRDLAPGGTAAWQGATQRQDAWESFAREGLAPHEERLMREVMDLCRMDGGADCGAALVRRPAETLVIEVRTW
jgi:hypothetical protein